FNHRQKALAEVRQASELGEGHSPPLTEHPQPRANGNLVHSPATSWKLRQPQARVQGSFMPQVNPNALIPSPWAMPPPSRPTSPAGVCAADFVRDTTSFRGTETNFHDLVPRSQPGVLDRSGLIPNPARPTGEGVFSHKSGMVCCRVRRAARAGAPRTRRARRRAGCPMRLVPAAAVRVL